MQTAGHGVFNFLQQLFSWHQVFFIWVWHVPLKAPLSVVVGSLHCWAGLEVLVGGGWGPSAFKNCSCSAASAAHGAVTGVGLRAERLWNALFPGASNAKLKIVESVESKNDICEIH